MTAIVIIVAEIPACLALDQQPPLIAETQPIVLPVILQPNNADLLLEEIFIAKTVLNAAEATVRVTAIVIAPAINATP